MDPSSAAALDLRAHLVAALVDAGRQDPALLVHHEDTLSWLQLADSAVAIVAVPDGVSADAFDRMLDAVVPAQGAGIVHVVIAGGGPAARARLEARGAAATGRALEIGFHHLDAQGTLAWVAGQPLPRPLAEAAAHLATSAPLPAARIAELTAQARRAHAEGERLAARLRSGRPAVTVVIGAACIVLFALGQYWAGGNFGAALWRMGASSQAALRQGELWRLLGAAFLHGNLTHLFFNMWALWSFGVFLEKLLGRPRYLLLYGLSALGGGLAGALLRSEGASVGASGAIFGLMGAGMALTFRPAGLLPSLTALRMRRALWMPMIVNVAYSFAPGIDALAHFGGGAVGVALVATGLVTRGAPPADAPARHPDPRGLVAAAVVIAILLAASVAASLATGRPWELRTAVF